MKNQKGFTLVEGLLIVLVLLVIGFGGYNVWSNNKVDDPESTSITEITETPSSEKNIETSTNGDEVISAKWITFESTKGWSVKVPDGWDVVSNNNSEGFWIGSTPQYSEGKPAVITVTDGGRGGPFALIVSSYTTGDPATQIPEYLTDESDFNVVNVNGKRYSGTLTQEYPMVGSVGNTVYWYVLQGDTKTVIFMHNDFNDTNSKEVLDLLEKSLSTFKFN